MAATALIASTTAPATSSTVALAEGETVRVGLMVSDIATFTGRIVLEEILGGELPPSRIGIIDRDNPAGEFSADAGAMNVRAVKGYTSQAAGLYVVGGTVG